MSGEGSRFKVAGYQTIKPLIQVNGKPIIEYVVDMFPGDNEFIFICREDHTKQYDLLQYLPSIAPNAQVIAIQPHKFGPVYAALQAKDVVKREIPTLLTYCDYFMNWDFTAFRKQVTDENADGNVICYKGFHPHLLHAKNVYAGCRVTTKKELLEIKEKYSFTEDKTLGFHSCGAYYFRTGQLMVDYFIKSIETDNSLNGEYYASLVYNLLIQDGLKVSVFDEIKHFCQWGTPEDLEEFLYWQDIFLKYKYQ